MRILLIQPPYDLYDDDERQAMPPLGLANIAAVLETHKHEVRIIDCIVEEFDRIASLPDGRRRHGLDGEGLLREINAFHPDVAGVSCLFSAQSPSAHHVCALVKQADPTIRTIMGGAHPSAVPGEVLDDPNVDWVVIGEGELTMLRLVESFEKGRFPPADLSGLAFRGDGELSINPLFHYNETLDALPLPARHLLKMERYFAYRAPHGAVVKRHPVTNMITSRGCPARCVFCSIHTVWGKKFRWHSPDRVIEEIEHLIAEYGVREIQFEDDNLTMHKGRMTQICRQMIDRKIDLTWTMPNGAAIWALDEELLDLMRRAGCYHVTLAVESGSQDVLKNIIKKPLDLKRVQPIIKACRKLGMSISLFFVVGFPGETREDLEKTFEFGLNLNADQVHFFTATPYPGTELFNQCVEAGMIRLPCDYTKLRIGRPFVGTPEWTAAELSEMTRAAQARFYRQTAIRRPALFLSTAISKFLREPRITMRKARDTFFPGVQTSCNTPGETTVDTAVQT